MKFENLWNKLRIELKRKKKRRFKCLFKCFSFSELFVEMSAYGQSYNCGKALFDWFGWKSTLFDWRRCFEFDE
jgi:hypothetical protein